MITKPNLQCGIKNIIIEHPITWAILPLNGGVEKQSLGGTTLKDIPWRKYEYTLSYEAMNKADFEEIEDLINLSNDFGLGIAFQYSLWRQTDSVVYVTARLISRSFSAGCYQKVDLILTELDPRAMIS